MDRCLLHAHGVIPTAVAPWLFGLLKELILQFSTSVSSNPFKDNFSFLITWASGMHPRALQLVGLLVWLRKFVRSIVFILVRC